MMQNQDRTNEYLNAVFQGLNSLSRKILTLDMYRNVTIAATEFSQNAIILNQLIFEEDAKPLEVLKDFDDLYMNGFQTVLKKGEDISRQMKILDDNQKMEMQEWVLAQNIEFCNNYTSLLFQNSDSFTYSEMEILENIITDLRNYPKEPQYKETYAYILDFDKSQKNKTPSQSLMDEVFEINRIYEQRSLVFNMLQDNGLEVLLKSISHEFNMEIAEREFAKFTEGKEIVTAPEPKENHTAKTLKFDAYKRSYITPNEDKTANNISQRLVEKAKLFAKGKRLLANHTDDEAIETLYDPSNYKTSVRKPDALIFSFSFKSNYASLIEDWKNASPEVKSKVQATLIQRQIFIDTHFVRAHKASEKLESLLFKYFDSKISSRSFTKILPKVKEVMRQSNKLLDTIMIESFTIKPKQAKILSFGSRVKE